MESRQVARQIAAVAAVLSVTTRVTDGEDWAIHGDEVVIGTARYTGAGLRGEPLTAAIMLDLWADVGLAVRSRPRTQLIRVLVRDRPHLHPLVTTIDRIQACAELMIAFPGYRAALADSVARRFSGDLRAARESAQLLAHTLLQAAAPDARCEVSHRVRRVLVPEEVLRVAMTPMDPPDARHTFVRLLASLLPAFETLLEEAPEGLTTTGTEIDEAEGDDAFGSTSSEGDATPGNETQDGDAEGESSGDERARPGDAPEHAEGADLFEAQQAGEIAAMLETPLATLTPTQLAGLVGDDDPTAEAPSLQDEPLEAEIVRAEVTEHLRVARYLERYRALEPEVEALRDIWHELVSEHAAATHRLGRTPEAEGETLMRQALPSAIAQARAGTPRPRAYAARVTSVRTQEAFGNIDIVLLIDRSGSMRVAAQHAADAALIVTEALAAVTRDVRDAERRLGLDIELELRTALIVFDTEPVVVKPLSAATDNASRASLVAESLATGGGTHDAAALEEAARQLGLVGIQRVRRDGVPRRRLVIMVSDGGSQESDRADSILHYLRERGVTVYGISVGTDALRERYGSFARRVQDPRDIVKVLHELIYATVHERG